MIPRILKSIITLATIFVLAGCCCFGMPNVNDPGKMVETVLEGEGSAKILMIDISGVIINAEGESGLFSIRENMLSSIREQLMHAAEDSNIRSVILRINSPGGTVTASDILYKQLLDFKNKPEVKKRGVKIVACFMDVGASGAYYIAMAADKIVAHPTTITGSLGVILQLYGVQGLMDKIGVSAFAVKSGELKDIGSPFRTMTEEEKKVLQSVIMTQYDRFVSVIDEGRPELSRDEILKLADGRIYSATQAYENKLIDRIGYISDAIEEAKRLAGVDHARVVTYHRERSFRNNIYSMLLPAQPRTEQFNLINIDLGRWLSGTTHPQFMYLWAPGAGLQHYGE
jgi:protease IV